MSTEPWEQELRAAVCHWCKVGQKHDEESCLYSPALLPIVQEAYAEGERAMQKRCAEAILKEHIGEYTTEAVLRTIRALPVEAAPATSKGICQQCGGSGIAPMGYYCDQCRGTGLVPRSGEPGAPSEEGDK